MMKSKWYFCPECGDEDIDHSAAPLTICANCGQQWYPESDYLEVVRGNLAKLRTEKIDADIAESERESQPVAQGEALVEFYVKCVRCHGEGMADIYVGSTGGSFNQPSDPVFERDACPECDGACFVLATPTIPTGHRVVPVEPTVAMNSKGAESLHESELGGVSFDSSAAFAYKAMLAAAPDAGGV